MDNSDVIERTARELTEPYRSDIARSLASKVHAVIVLDQAGRHTTGKLRVPENRGLRLAGYGIKAALTPYPRLFGSKSPSRVSIPITPARPLTGLSQSFSAPD